MSAINGKRVLAGGLITGAIIALSNIACELILGTAWSTRLQQLGITPPGESAVLAMIGAAFAVGMISMWLYALAIPRLGAKMETACMVGVSVWALSCLVPNVTYVTQGILTPSIFAISSLLGLIQVPVALCVGSRFYRDEGVTAVRTLGSRAA